MSKIHLGKIKGKPLMLPPNALTTHAFVAGMTGSGKTGNVLGLAEELVRNGTPTILVDVKGDLANLALQPENSLLTDAMAIRYVTPGGYHGESVNLMSGLGDKERITPTVTALLKLVGVEADPIRSVEHAYLSTILQIRHDLGVACSLVDLVKAVIDPGFESLGAMDLSSVMPSSKRTALASKLNTVCVAPSFDAWKTGIALDVGKLLAPRPDGRVPVVIYSVAHLVEDDDRVFALSFLLDAIVSWTRTLSGSDDLRAAVVVDECYGLLPPYPSNPPTKRPLLTLLKQARAFGVGLVLATQNPVDLDYKALSNCGVWCIGRLQTAKDRERVIDAVCGTGAYEKKTLGAEIASLKPREFLFCSANHVYRYYTRDVSCSLKGPMSPSAIQDLYQACTSMVPPDTVAVIKQKLAEAKAMAETDASEVWVLKVAQLETLLAEYAPEDFPTYLQEVG